MSRPGAPEWESCVTHGRLTYCGRTRYALEWTFLNAEHARRTVAQDGRLTVCPECKKAMAAEVETETTERSR